jgi:hypothetical protein
MNRFILAIDPGPVTSGWVLFDGKQVLDGRPDTPNGELVDQLRYTSGTGYALHHEVAIEWISNMGMTVGASVFETCYWAGVFDATTNMRATRIKRIDVKKHICGATRAKDSNIRAALIDRFGGIEGKAKAVGKKANPGPIYGVRTHMWAALAVAVTWWDLHKEDMT